MNDKLKWVFFFAVMLGLIFIGNAILAAFLSGAVLIASSAVLGLVLGAGLANPFLKWLGIRE